MDLVANGSALAARIGAALQALRRDRDDGKAAGKVEPRDLVTEIRHGLGELGVASGGTRSGTGGR